MSQTPAQVVHEKLFVHTDQSFYLAGEILWFKLYAVDGSTHKPLDLSKIAYVEVLDSNNLPVLQAKIALERATGNGSFFLPFSLATGNYKLRAYTNWMKNFGPDYFFEELITIVNTLKVLPNTAKTKPGGYHVAFFPEGGNLVKGLPTRIAFQVTDAYGRGASCAGAILDANKDTVTTFRTLRSGIGSFLFTPSAGPAPTAIIRLPDGQTLPADLPPVYDRGLVMNVTEKDHQLEVKVHSNGLPSANIYLVVQAAQTIRLAREAPLAPDSAVFLIDRSLLAEGVNQLTLFNAARQPVCERLYFQKPASPLPINAKTDKAQYGTREKVRLELSVADEPVPAADSSQASLSLAVYRLDPLHPPTEINIFNYLWLLADLRGTIESPDAYFTTDGEAADLALDNLMLTHGWRRFRWPDIPDGNSPPLPYPPEFIAHLITGRLTDRQSGLPLAGRIAHLSIPGINFYFGSAQTDSAGKFFFDVPHLYGPSGIIIHSGEAKDSPCKVEVFSPFSQQYSDRRLSPVQLGDDQDGLTDHSIGMQAQNVYSGDSLQRFRTPSRDSVRFFGKPDHSYLLDDYTRFTTMEDVLREYVREMSVDHAYGRQHVRMLNEPARQPFDDNEDLVLLDGIPVPDDKILLYDPLKIRKIDIVSRQYFQGPSVFDGIASFTTYNGDHPGFALDPHSLSIDYEGLQLQQEFYSPVYTTQQAQDTPQPDFRTLLFWSPAIKTTAHGKKESVFYTSDLPGNYVAVIQGMTPDGRVGVKNVYFTVSH